MKPFKTIGITVKSALGEKDEIVERVYAVLRSTGRDVRVDSKRMKDVACTKGLKDVSENGSIDLMLVIGGDGTILRAVREMHDYSVPVLSVNRGAVGFLAEVSIDEIEEALPKLLDGEGVMEERSILSVEVIRDGKTEFTGRSLNEAVITQGSIARLLDLKTSVGGEPLANFHADGLIVATPTGSTAYSLAAGGPIVHPRIPAMILTPINPHTFNQKPIVIPGTQSVEMEVLRKMNSFVDSDVSLTLDGQVYHKLRRFDLVRVTMHGDTAKFVRRTQDTFYATLRNKLKWGERPGE